MDSKIAIPNYVKVTFILVGLIAMVSILHIGEYLIVPLLYALIFAILLNPLIEFLVRNRFNRVFAIAMVVLITVIAALFILYLIFAQVTLFYDSYPILRDKYQILSGNFIQWLSSHFKIKIDVINAWIYKSQIKALDNLGSSVSYAIDMINSFLFIAVLLPVYLFLFLYYKEFLVEFVRRLFLKKDHLRVFEVLENAKNIIQKYLVGLLLEALIVAVLNSVGLLIIGIEYAVVLGVGGAILNVVPYLGGLLSTTIPVIIALVTKESYSYAIAVICVYLFIQIIDNNFIVPKIVAAKVKLNALISILVVILGGTLWGIPGMFLSIPITAILKIVFDHIESLKSWGFLLGNATFKKKSKTLY